MAGNPQTRPGQLAHIPPKFTSSHWGGQRVGALGHLGKVDFGDSDVTPAGCATRGDGFFIHHSLSDMCDGDEHRNHTQLSVSPTPHRPTASGAEILRSTQSAAVSCFNVTLAALNALSESFTEFLSSQKPISWNRA